jgi:inner membrane protein
MPTIFSHPAVPLGIAPWFRRLPKSLVVAGAIVSSLPDVDVVAFRYGIPYEHPLGHRGLTHSIAFALLLASLAAFVYVRSTRRSVPFATAFAFLFISLLSHGLLDAMTNGGKGVGFFIPFSDRRYFLPFRPIRVSPIGAEHFAAKAGAVLQSELLWVWLPFACVAVVGLTLRFRRPVHGSRATGRRR